MGVLLGLIVPLYKGDSVDIFFFSRDFVRNIALLALSTKDRDAYDIKKFDGTNFALWKEQIQDVLV